MKAKLQKLAANKDTKDSIQFQLNEELTEEFGEDILTLRRYDFVEVTGEGNQSVIDGNGVIDFPKFQFQSINTSISLCVTEKGIIATLTFSFEDPLVFDNVIKNKLRNKLVSLSFTEGKNPFNS